MSTTKGPQTVDAVAPGQTVEVTVQYSGVESSSGYIAIVDRDATFAGSEFLAGGYIDTGSGTATFEVSRQDLKDAQGTLEGGNIEVTAFYKDGGSTDPEVNAESNQKDVGFTGTTVYLKNVDTSVARGGTDTVTVYGWSKHDYAGWEFRESDSFGNPLVASGSEWTGSSGYYEATVSYTPSNYEDSTGDPPVEMFAKTTENGRSTPEVSVSIVDNQPPSFDSLSVSPGNPAEGELVTFEGSVSDPEGDDLELSMTQTGGPSLSSSGVPYLDGTQVEGNFIAPEVSPGSSEEVTLEFTLDDGTSTTTKTLTVPIDNAQANIADVSLPSGTFQRGDVVTSSVLVENVGTEQRTFYVGYGARAESESTWRDNDGTTHEAVTLSPGESEWVTVSWTVESDAPYEWYDLSFRVWENGDTSQNAELTELLESRTDSDVFDVNGPPTADAGSDVTVQEGSTVDLTGSGSDPDGDSLSYEWSKVGGDGSISGSGQTVTYEAPSGISSDTSATLELTVDDGDASDTDSLTVTVTDDTSNNDPDGDGIPNSEDECDNEAEDDDGYQDADGCPENGAPTADAGSDRTITEGSTVDLTGSGSDPDGDSLSYEWSKVGGDGTLSGTGQTVTYEAASGISSDTSATLELTVRDGNGKSATDRVTVTVSDSTGDNDPDGDGIPNSEDECDNEAEDDDGYQDADGCPENGAPTADAGGDVTVREGSSVQLTGSGSDPDSDSLSYEWTKVDGVGSLSGSGQTVTYGAPADVSSDTSATLELTVSDGNGKSATDRITVTVTDDGSSGTNEPPTADAGSDRSVSEGGSVDLDGAASDPDGTVQETNWRVVDGPGSMSGNTYRAPSGLSNDATATVELTVTDDDGASASDTARVTVESTSDDTNSPPTADAGVDRTVSEGETVELDGYGSSDPDGDALAYSWTQTDGPSVTLVDADSPRPSFTAPEVDGDATLTVDLRVTDPDGASDTDTVTVTVTDGSTTTGFVTGRVSDVENNDIADAVVELRDPDTGSVVASTTSDANGEYTLEVAPGTYDGVVSKSGYTETSLSVTVESGMTTVSNAVVQRLATPSSVMIVDATRSAPADGSTPATVTVEVRDGDGDSMSGVAVIASPVDGTTTVDGDFVTKTTDADGRVRFEFTASEAQSVDVEFALADDSSVATQSVLEFTSATTNDRFEPNDELAEATPTDTGETLEDLVLVGDEADTFALSLSADETVNASIDFDHDAADLDLVLVDREGVVLEVSQTLTDGETLSYTATESGTYYVGVYAYDNGTAAYTLSTSGDTGDSASPPSAEAGPDIAVSPGGSVTLDATGSTDPGNDITSYEWTQTDGPIVSLDDGPTPSFTAPADGQTSMTFEVTVTDEHGATDTDTVTVTILGNDRTASLSADAPASAAPGSTFSVEYELTNDDATAANGGRLELDTPAGVTVASASGQGSPALDGDPPTVFYGLSGPIDAGDTRTTTVTFSVAEDAEGEVTIGATGFVEDSRAAAETTVSVGDGLAQFDTNGRPGIQGDEVQAAIVAFNTGGTVGGQSVSGRDVQQVIVAFNTGSA